MHKAFLFLFIFLKRCPRATLDIYLHGLIFSCVRSEQTMRKLSLPFSQECVQQVFMERRWQIVALETPTTKEKKREDAEEGGGGGKGKGEGDGEGKERKEGKKKNNCRHCSRCVGALALSTPSPWQQAGSREAMTALTFVGSARHAPINLLRIKRHQPLR